MCKACTTYSMGVKVSIQILPPELLVALDLLAPMKVRVGQGMLPVAPKPIITRIVDRLVNRPGHL